MRWSILASGQQNELPASSGTALILALVDDQPGAIWHFAVEAQIGSATNWIALGGVRSIPNNPGQKTIMVASLPGVGRWRVTSTLNLGAGLCNVDALSAPGLTPDVVQAIPGYSELVTAAPTSGDATEGTLQEVRDRLGIEVAQESTQANVYSALVAMAQRLEHIDEQTLPLIALNDKFWVLTPVDGMTPGSVLQVVNFNMGWVPGANNWRRLQAASDGGLVTSSRPGTTTQNAASGAPVESLVALPFGGRLSRASCVNLSHLLPGGEQDLWFQIFNRTTPPVLGLAPVITLPCPARKVAEFISPQWRSFTTGVYLAISTTPDTFTGAGAAGWFTSECST